MGIRHLVLVLASCAVVGACGTTKVDLRYATSATAVRTPENAPRVEVGSFVDQRGEPANWLGAIRGGFGNPLKNLESSTPVSQIVGRAFAEGLQARRYIASAGPGGFQVSGVIRKL